ncbi:MAG: hypothetical protein JWP61_1513 [Friedmanniella sp.]|nr:hypothetical protein [Friedmanniella sp.]
MRTARLVGLSPDGKSLIVAVDGGEQLAIAADERLRAAVRGDRPRLGQLEIEMESSLSPRDIQTRIRSGETIEEVARAAGVPQERVERFAAPVLAERDHIALTAMAASVRRRGETSGHRNLRLTVTERLLARGVDIDTIAWDAYRLEDGHWSVTADYRSGESERHATFTFDLRGRFSVAADDDARWLLGEQSPTKGPQPGRRRPEHGEHGERGEAAEPTLDLTDELALVRATQEPSPVRPRDESSEPTVALVRTLTPVADLPPEPPATEDLAEPADDRQQAPDSAAPDETEPIDPSAGPGSTSPHDWTPEVGTEHEEAGEQESPLETLYGMLGSPLGEDAPKAYAGLSDASAVPETAEGGWEPAIVVNYPVEPSQDDDQPGAPEAPAGPHRAHLGLSLTEAPELTDEDVELDGASTDAAAPPQAIVDYDDREEEAVEFEAETHAPAAAPTPEEPVAQEPAAEEKVAEEKRAAPKPAAKRKRASVPSWDEIMFGGPKPPS